MELIMNEIKKSLNDEEETVSLLKSALKEF